VSDAHGPDRPLHTGRCIGGPLDGREVSVRYPIGFLAVDRVAGLAWLYRLDADGAFRLVEDGQGRTVRPLDEDGRRQVVDDPRYDVLAVDTAGGG
jgi:hypothetical protein